MSGIKFKTAPPADGERAAGTDEDRQSFLERLFQVRAASRALAAPLSAEDQTVQTMPDVSPTKWHLAHTTWFFENFILQQFAPGYGVFNPDFDYLFNSYYHTVGTMHPRPQRGLISRPSVDEVIDFRSYVDESLRRFLDNATHEQFAQVRLLLEIGLNHEQQHQELMMTDIKHVLSVNPLAPRAYAPPAERPPQAIDEIDYVEFEGGLVEIGHTGPGFAFDNETPRHKVHVPAFRLADRPVTNAEYRRFIEDGGYERVDLWLSDGWATIQERGWNGPLYWSEENGRWFEFTLAGRQQLDSEKPVAHISYYEADAYARWAGKRLPTESELEIAAEDLPVSGHFLKVSSEGFRAPEPRPAPPGQGLRQIYGDVWEWTQSPYTAYPGFKPLSGSLGEYNGKFMCNQLVLRGGSSATPHGHMRPSYRNFFPPDSRWQFTGIRLAEDA